MKNYTIQTVEKAFLSNIIGEISIEEYISLVRDGYQIDKITEARKYKKGDTIYDNIKLNRFGFLFNCKFKHKRQDEDIIGQTGLLFIDVDDNELGNLDMSQIFILHKSFGGNGYTIIVKVEYMPYDNADIFKLAYEDICTQLGIYTIKDNNAIKRTQYTALSYDKDIIVNYDSNILSLTKWCTQVSLVNNTYKNINRDLNAPCTPSTSIDNTTKNFTVYLNAPFSEKDDIGDLNAPSKYKFSTKNDLRDNLEIKLERNGKEYCEIFTPKIIKNGFKHTYLSTNMRKFIYINNLDVNSPEIYTHLSWFYNKVKDLFESEVPEKNIINIMNNVIKTYDANKIKKKKLKVIFPKKSIMNKEEKQSYARKQVAEWQTEDTLNKLTDIYNYILENGGKPTQKKLVELSGMCLRTVKKYWKEII